MQIRTLLLVMMLGCGKGSSSSSGSATTAEATGAGIKGLSFKIDPAPDFSKLTMPPAERDQIEAIYKADQTAVAQVRGLAILSIENARAIAAWKGKVLILAGLAEIDQAAAAELAKWPGDTMFLGLDRVDTQTATALATWKGKSLHLDEISLDASTAAELAKFTGTTLGLAHAKLPPEASEALAKFTSGAVAVALDPATKVDSTVSVPPAESEADLATLGRVSRAIDDGDIEAVKDFLKSGGKADMNEHGTTLLMEAANMRQVEIAKVLIAAGANVNAISQTGDTPMSLALSDSDFGPRKKDPATVLAIAKVLVEAGAQTSPKATGGDLYRSPLENAARLGDPALVTYLIDKGAKADSDALVEAIDKGDPDTTALMLKAGADVNPKNPAMGHSPIFQAISQGASEVEMARYDKKPPADVQKLITARLAVLDKVLAAKADLSARDDRGQTPLEAALNGGVLEFVSKVLDAGAKLDEKDADGKTPLQYLAGNTRLEEKDTLPLAKLLLDKKSPKDGAADIAEKTKRPALAKLLR